jgi:hypothetical protein
MRYFAAILIRLPSRSAQQDGRLGSIWRIVRSHRCVRVIRDYGMTDRRQFNLRPLTGKAITAPEMWTVVLAA